MTVARGAATSRLEVASLRKSFGAAEVADRREAGWFRGRGGVAAGRGRRSATQALKGVDLALAGGEVVALVGENGAGKSTLIKILAGVLARDSGTIAIDGSAVDLAGPADAMAHGIAVIHQELMLCDNLSVAANLCLGRDPLRWRALGWIDGARRLEASRRALERVGLDVDPRRPVSALAPAARQLVEIARALDLEARFVIMDEPTSSLDRRDTERLLRLIAGLRGSGIGVLYVSHRLEEVVEVADRAVVLRDGAAAGELARGELDADALVRLMIGRTAHAGPVPGGGGGADGERAAAGSRRALRPVLRARALRTSRAAPAVTFDLHAGEILGLFGLVGAGRTELLETLFGLRGAAGGSLIIGGGSESAGERAYTPRRAADAIAAGLALVPEERKSQGLIAEMSVGDNLNLAAIARRPLLARRRRGDERRLAAELCTGLDVRPPRPEIEVARLSGGNQQKVVLGKWLAIEPRLLLLDEPTRGVDVGARADIHARLRDLATRGVAVLLSSAETEEILALADRALVLRRGALAGTLAGAELTERNLLRLAAGA
jgi:ribose transport system ATP-binding protein